MVVKRSRMRLVSSITLKELETLNKDKVLKLIPYARCASQEYSAQIKNNNAKKSAQHSNSLSNLALKQQNWTQESWDQGPQWNQNADFNQKSNNSAQKLNSSKNNNEVKILKRNDEKVGKQIKIRIETGKAFIQDLRTKMIFLTTIHTAKELFKILNKTFAEAKHSNPELLKLFKYKKRA
ncbi:MAG: hypothetical protein QXL94_01430 [Candidatus Parvarchaeum sp.]